jgi:hypothetical protein
MPVYFAGPHGLHRAGACIDCAADDTVFPSRFAQRLGVDLTNVPRGTSRAVSGASLSVRYATVTLFITDLVESCEWDAIVGFTDAPLRWGLLGHAGFLQFFDARLLGAKLEAVLAPNASFPGQHVAYTPAPP